MIHSHSSALADGGKLWGGLASGEEPPGSQKPLPSSSLHIHTQAYTPTPPPSPALLEAWLARCCVGKIPPQEGPALSWDGQAYTGAQKPGWTRMKNNPVPEQLCVCEPSSPYNIHLVTLPTCSVLSIAISVFRFFISSWVNFDNSYFPRKAFSSSRFSKIWARGCNW